MKNNKLVAIIFALLLVLVNCSQLVFAEEAPIEAPQVKESPAEVSQAEELRSEEAANEELLSREQQGELPLAEQSLDKKPLSEAPATENRLSGKSQGEKTLLAEMPATIPSPETSQEEDATPPANTEIQVAPTLTLTGFRLPKLGENIREYISEMQAAIKLDTPHACISTRGDWEGFAVRNNELYILKSDTVFQAGTEYEFFIYIDAKEGYKFSGREQLILSPASLDFSPCVPPKYVEKDGQWVWVPNYRDTKAISFTATYAFEGTRPEEEYVAPTLTLTGFRLPELGENILEYISEMQAAIKLDTPHACISTRGDWEGFAVRNTDLSIRESDTVFQAGTEYEFSIDIDAKEGYKFSRREQLIISPASLDFSPRVPKKQVEKDEQWVWEPDYCDTQRISFTATYAFEGTRPEEEYVAPTLTLTGFRLPELGENILEYISEMQAAIKLDTPHACISTRGYWKGFAVQNDDLYVQNNGLYILNSDAVFQAGTEYKLSIEITAKEGYKFSGREQLILSPASIDFSPEFASRKYVEKDGQWVWVPDYRDTKAISFTATYAFEGTCPEKEYVVPFSQPDPTVNPDSEYQIKLKDDNTLVSASYDEETFKAASVQLVVQPKELADGKNTLAAYDISFVDENGTKVQPEAGKRVMVSIPQPDGLGDSFQVIHVLTNGTEQPIRYNVKDGYIFFEADSFSVYKIRNVVQNHSDGGNKSISSGVDNTTPKLDLKADQAYEPHNYFVSQKQMGIVPQNIQNTVTPNIAAPAIQNKQIAVTRLPRTGAAENRNLITVSFAMGLALLAISAFLRKK